MLETVDVVQRFGGLVAVDSASIRVDVGEIVGLIGPNGAGKSTLFNVIAGVYRPSAGRVLSDGKDVTGRRPHALATQGLARTFQTPRPFGTLSVLANVMVAAFTVEPRERRARAWAAQCLHKVGLEQYADLPASSLPLGIRKRLEVARAIALRSKVLLLDEVLGGLNPDETDAMIEVIQQLRDDGVAVCMIEHVMPVIMSVCDRIYVLHHGKIIASGTPDEVAQHPEVIEAYLGEGGS